jgi:hypothetical protein
MRLCQGPIRHKGDYHLRVRDRHEVATASRTAAGSAAHPLRATDPAALCPALPKRG